MLDLQNIELAVFTHISVSSCGFCTLSFIPDLAFVRRIVSQEKSVVGAGWCSPLFPGSHMGIFVFPLTTIFGSYQVSELVKNRSPCNLHTHVHPGVIIMGIVFEMPVLLRSSRMGSIQEMLKIQKHEIFLYWQPSLHQAGCIHIVHSIALVSFYEISILVFQ